MRRDHDLQVFNIVVTLLQVAVPLLFAQFVPQEETRKFVLQEVRKKVWEVNQDEGIKVVGFPVPSLMYNISNYVEILACRTNEVACNAGLRLNPETDGLIRVLNPIVTKRLLNSKTVRHTGGVTGSSNVEGSLTYEKEFETSVEISTTESHEVSHAVSMSTKFSIELVAEVETRHEFTATYNFQTQHSTVETSRDKTASTLTFSTPPEAETTVWCSYDQVEFISGNFAYQLKPTGPVMIVRVSNDEKEYQYLPWDNQRAKAEYWLPEGTTHRGSFKGSSGMNIVCEAVTKSLNTSAAAGNETSKPTTPKTPAIQPITITTQASEQPSARPVAQPGAIPSSDWSNKLKTGLHSSGEKCNSIILVKELGAFKDPEEVKNALKCIDGIGNDGWYDKDCAGVRFYMYLSKTDERYKSYKSCLRDAIMRGFGFAYLAAYDDYGYRKHDISEEKDYVSCFGKAKTRVSHLTVNLLKDCLELNVNGWLEEGFNCSNSYRRGNFRSDGRSWNTPRDGWNFCKPCYTRALEAGYSWAGCKVKWGSARFDSSMDINQRSWDLSEWPTENF